MITKFLSLNDEKRNRILNAAINEFAQKGYENASTNEIVKGANISKGLLFHYFKNKNDLYFFLYEHFVEVLMDEFFDEMDLDETDVFTRLKNVMMLKSQLMKKYPDIFNFIMAAQMETSSEVKSELIQKNNDLVIKNSAQLFENIDISKFKDGLDVQKAMNIIMWTLEGFGNQVLEKVKRANNTDVDFTEEFVEIDSYLEILKKSFYREGLM